MEKEKNTIVYFFKEYCGEGEECNYSIVMPIYIYSRNYNIAKD